MLSLGEVKCGKVILFRGEPYEVVRAEQSLRGRGGSVLNTKLKNLRTGNLIDQTFHGDTRLDEAELETAKAQYLYAEGDSFYFMDSATYEQFSLVASQVGELKAYLQDGTEGEVLKFRDQYLKLSLPIKMKFKVISAPPGVRGDTAQGGTKTVEIETGAKIATPLFIEEGDLIVVDTRDGSYVERAGG